MHWKFEPLFSIQIGHDLLPTTPELDPPVFFTLQPMPETLRLLQQYKWVFKSQPNGAVIFSEKTVLPNGTAIVQYPLETLMAFDFRIDLVDTSVLRKTKPYMKIKQPGGVGPVVPETVAEIFPAFSGRSRIWYFDNLDSNDHPDQIQLTADSKVGFGDLASVLPLKTNIQAPSTITQAIDFESITPKNAFTKSVKFSSSQRTAEIDLPAGAYRFKPDAGAPDEVIFADDTAAQRPPFGLVRIYKDQTLDYANPMAYTLNFSKV